MEVRNMALIGHWPLNGNLNDYSGKSTAMTNFGATTSSGKIGACYQTDGTSQYLRTPVMSASGEFTFAIWFKALTYETNDRIVWGYGTNRVIIALQSSNRLQWYIQTVNGTVGYTSTVLTVNPTGWNHVALTYNGSTIKMYINGVQDSNTGSLTGLSAASAFNIGTSYNASNYFINAQFNDIRFYDNALSLTEIKELSRAKILHYTFDAMQEPTTNIFPRAYNVLAFTNAYNGSAYSFGATTNMQQVIDNTLKTDTLSTVTKVSRINSGVNQRDYVYVGLSSPLNSTRVISFWYYGTYGTAIRPYNNDGYELIYYLDNNGVWQGGNIFQTVPVLENTWQKIILKIVNQGVSAGAGWSWTILHSNSLSATLDNTEYWAFTEFQFEEKDHATEYTRTSRTGLVYDNSGFQNNSAALTEATTPTWSSTARIGSGNYYFNGTGASSSFINAKDVQPKADAITISSWIKLNALISAQDNAYPKIIGKRDVDTHRAFFLSFNKSNNRLYWEIKDENATYFTLSSTNTTWNVGEWYHVAASFNGITGAAAVYVNGAKDSTTWALNHIPITSANTYIGGNGNYRLNAYIDDVRIYATALSDADVLDLYQTGAEVHKSGLLFARDFYGASDATNEITKTGTASFMEFSTVGITDGLVLYLDASDPSSYSPSELTWKDLSGYNNHAILNGNTNNPIWLGNSFYFPATANGINGAMKINNSASLNALTTMTIELIFTLETKTVISGDSDWMCLFSKAVVGSTQAPAISINQLSGNRYLHIERPTVFNSTTNIFTDYTGATWYHVIAIIDSTSYGYLNGNQVSTSSGGITANTYDIYLGTDYDNEMFKGKLSLVKIFNRALSPLEIKQEYSAIYLGEAQISKTGTFFTKGLIQY